MLSTKYHLPEHSFRQGLIDVISLAIFFGIFYAILIGSYALFTPDEGRYSEVAREMVITGDYITPRLNGVVFLDKPVLYYWLQASAINLFGLKEWALRFWPAFFGVFGVLMTYIAGYSLFNRRTGLLSATILATCPLYYGAAHYANVDLEVAVLISTSLLFFIMAINTPSASRRFYLLIGSYVFAGLAFLTKGLIGIVFPTMIIGTWIVLLNRWDILKKMHLMGGLLLFIAVVTPWCFLAHKANPTLFLKFFFITQQISRFLTTDYFNNRTPAWFYIPIVLTGLFPWCVFIIPTLLKHINSVFKQRKQKMTELFLLLWFFLIFFFFSIPKSKTVGYILPIFPALSLLIGSYLNRYWEKSQTKGITLGITVFQLVCLIITLGCIIVPRLHFFNLNQSMIFYLTLTALIFGTSGVIIFFQMKKPFSHLFTILSITAGLFLLVIIASGSTLNEKTIKPLALQIKPLLHPHDEIVAFYKYSQDLPIYLERRITIVADWDSKDIPLNDNWVRELWYGMPFQETKSWLIKKDIFWERWYSNKRLFVFTNEDYYADLLKYSKRTVYKLGKYNDFVLLSNQP